MATLSYASACTSVWPSDTHTCVAEAEPAETSREEASLCADGSGECERSLALLHLADSHEKPHAAADLRGDLLDDGVAGAEDLAVEPRAAADS